MIKLVDMLVREDGVSHEEFVERWQGPHAELARDLPGLRKYTTSVPRDPSRSEHDGILELYFDDTAAMKEAFDSEIGRRVQADAAEFIDMEQGPTYIVSETVHVDLE